MFIRGSGKGSIAAYETTFIPFLTPMVQELINRLNLQLSTRLLDVGTGTGLVPRLAAREMEQGGKIVGIDVEEEMVRVASSRAREAGILDMVEFKIMDPTSLEFEDNSFESVTSAFSMSSAREPKTVLREVRRVLVTNGIFGLCAWGKEPYPEMERIWREMLDTYDEKTRRGLEAEKAKEEMWRNQNTVRSLVGEAGFRNITFGTKIFSGSFSDLKNYIQWMTTWPSYSKVMATLGTERYREFLRRVRAELKKHIRSNKLNWSYEVLYATGRK
jgi:ubiquinone/menaquinone biosynthesis C-methylase UbiE